MRFAERRCYDRNNNSKHDRDSNWAWHVDLSVWIVTSLTRLKCHGTIQTNDANKKTMMMMILILILILMLILMLVTVVVMMMMMRRRRSRRRTTMMVMVKPAVQELIASDFSCIRQVEEPVAVPGLGYFDGSVFGYTVYAMLGLFVIVLICGLTWQYKLRASSEQKREHVKHAGSYACSCFLIIYQCISHKKKNSRDCGAFIL